MRRSHIPDAGAAVNGSCAFLILYIAFAVAFLPGDLAWACLLFFLYCFFGFDDWLVFLGAVLYIRSVSRLQAAVFCRVMPVLVLLAVFVQWVFRKAVF